MGSCNWDYKLDNYTSEHRKPLIRRPEVQKPKGSLFNRMETLVEADQTPLKTQP